MVVEFPTTYAIGALVSPLNIVGSIPSRGGVYSIQLIYAMKSGSDLRKVSSFLWLLWFLPPIKL
jgi:hypothetical protein